MVIYEVTISVESNLVAEFGKYLEEVHIREVLVTGYFTGATLLRSGDKYRVQYAAHNISQVEEYIENAAAGLRADVMERFPSGLFISRDIWELKARYKHGSGSGVDFDTLGRC